MTIGIVAFAFGTPGSIRSNKIIGDAVSTQARRFRAPVYTQADVLLPDDIQVKYTKEEIGNPPPTLRIARGAVMWAKEREIDRLWVIAANPHAWRAIRDVEAAVREAGLDIVVYKEGGFYGYKESCWFCPDSTQPRTQSKKAWEKRECILRIMPFWLYKLVAS